MDMPPSDSAGRSDREPRKARNPTPSLALPLPAKIRSPDAEVATGAGGVAAPRSPKAAFSSYYMEKVVEQATRAK